MNQLLSELNRRNVTRVALLYAGVSWLLIQIAETVLPIFDVSTAFLRILVILLLIGFVVAVVLAWFYNITPDGVRPDDPAQTSLSGASGRGMNLAIGVVLAAAALAFVSNQAGWFHPADNMASERSPGLADASEDEIQTNTNSRAAVLVRGVAVLPFENLSEAQENAFFAAGVHDEILTNLASVRDFRVISRTSMRRYADTLLPIPDIASQLGVSHVMEGSVRRFNDRVRVTVLLVDAMDDEPIWSESYDRTLVDIFEIQSDIARQIVANIQGELSPALSAGLGARSTADTAAYELYLEARAGFQSDVRSAEILRQPLTLIRQSLDADPGFVEAWVELVRICGGLVWWDAIEYKDCAAEALQQVRLLAPESARRLMAEGIYAYRVERDFEGALDSLRAAASLLPNDAPLWQFVGYSARRSGRWTVALDALRKVIELDPLDQSSHDDLLVTLAASGDPQQAIQWGKQASAKFPDNKLLPFIIADIKRQQTGDLTDYVVAMEQLPPTLRSANGNVWIDGVFDNHQARQQWIAEAIDSGIGNPFWATGMDSTFHLLNARPLEARTLGQEAYREFRQRIGDNWEGQTAFNLAVWAMLSARAGEVTDARRALALFEASVQGRRDQIMEMDQFFACIAYANLGDLDSAWTWLTNMLNTPLGLTVWDLRQDRVLQHFFSDYPPFQERISAVDLQ